MNSLGNQTKDSSVHDSVCCKVKGLQLETECRIKANRQKANQQNRLFFRSLEKCWTSALIIGLSLVVCCVSNCCLFLLQISITEDGAAANFTRSFGMKSGYYLCYSKVTDRDTMNTEDASCPLFSALVPPAFLLQIVSLFSLQDLAGGMVVTDIQLISDKESIPHGYCYIAEHLEPSKYKHTCAVLSLLSLS